MIARIHRMYPEKEQQRSRHEGHAASWSFEVHWSYSLYTTCNLSLLFAFALLCYMLTFRFTAGGNPLLNAKTQSNEKILKYFPFAQRVP